MSINFENNSLVMVVTVYIGVVFAASWFAMVLWAYRDMRARSRDSIAQVLVAFMVAVLNAPGLIIYIFLRPRETLSEAYERSLEEEALLQEIEDKPLCPTCRHHVHDEWQACPHCHTRLKKNCVHCGEKLDLTWDICPHCATPQSGGAENHNHVHHHMQPRTVDDYRWMPKLGQDVLAAATQARPPESLEFIEGDDF